MFLTASHTGKRLFIQRAQTAQSGIYSYLANTPTHAMTSSLHPTDSPQPIFWSICMGIWVCGLVMPHHQSDHTMVMPFKLFSPLFPSNLPLKLFLPPVSQLSHGLQHIQKNKVFFSMCMYSINMCKNFITLFVFSSFLPVYSLAITIMYTNYYQN